MKIAALFGRVLIGLATVVLITGLLVFALGSYLATLPLMKLTASGRKMQAMTGLFVALVALGRALGSDDDPAPS